METYLTPPNIMFIIGLIGVIITVYNTVRNPQVTSEKNDSLMELSIAQLGKDLANLRDNHVHSLDIKLDETNKVVTQISIQVAKLATIIEERIPKK